MRTITARGLVAWTTSQPSSNCSITRGVKFSTHEVGLLDEAQRQPAPFGPVEVEGEAALVGVRGEEERAVLPPVVAVGLTPPVKRMPSGRVADSTWMTSAPSAASIADADGPAHQRGEVEDLDARERQRPAPCVAADLGRPGDDRAGVLAQARRRPRRG